MIDGLNNADVLPLLERVMQFAGQRHRLIVNNIANLNTPGFRPMDVSVDEFQQQLGEAVDARRENHGPFGGALELEESEQVSFTKDGPILHPQAAANSILFHDGSEKNIERSMQDLVENFSTFRLAADLLRNRVQLLETAIRGRI